MGNSLLAVRGINHKYIVVGRRRKTVNSEKFERRLYMKLHVKKMQERMAVGIIVEREGSIDESACVYYRCMCGV